MATPHGELAPTHDAQSVRDDVPGDEHVSGQHEGYYPRSSSDTAGTRGDIDVPGASSSRPQANEACQSSPSDDADASKEQRPHAAVDIDHFDPAGVKQLQRTLSKQSDDPHAAACCSELTLNGLEIGDGPFDLEKFLRTMMKQ